MQVSVDVIDVVSGARTVDPEKQDFLTLSIKEVGLISPVTLVENPSVAGRYTMVAGRNRLTAVRKLGWGQIDANVRTLGEAEAELVEISENLARSDYTVIERAAAMARYVTLFAARHPEHKEYLERTRDRQNRNLSQNKGQADAAVAEAEVEEAPPSPVEAVAAQFNVHPRTVRKSVKRAEAFSDEQRAVLADRKLAQEQVDELVAIPDRSECAQVVNLLAAGMAYPEAMKDVLGDRYEDREEDQTDDEFLASCPARGRTDRAKFDADALFYREVRKHRTAFARAIGWSARKAKVGSMGVYARRLMLFLEAKHPREWVVCSQCLRGQTAKGDCGACRGGGYLLG